MSSGEEKMRPECQCLNCTGNISLLKKEIFRSDRNVHYLDGGDCFISVFVHQNLTNGTL